MSSSSLLDAPVKAPSTAAPPTEFVPGTGMYTPQPATKRKNKFGKYDITTPSSLMDREQNYVAVLTAGENRHPNEDEILEHFARQFAAKKEGTYDPLEDPPVVLRDLLPTVFVVVNKVFSQHEIVIGGEARIKDYVEKLKDHIDFDIIPVMCGQPQILPLHPLVPVKHRDPIFNAQMEGFYKQHDKSAKEILERVIAAQEESKKKIEEQERKNKEKEEAAAKATAIEPAKPAEPAATAVDEEDDEE